MPSCSPAAVRACRSCANTWLRVMAPRSKCSTRCAPFPTTPICSPNSRSRSSPPCWQWVWGSACDAWSDTVIRINLLPQEERVKERKLPTLPIPRLGSVLPFALLGGLGLAVTTVATMQNRQVAQLSHDIAEARREAESYKPQLEK